MGNHGEFGHWLERQLLRREWNAADLARKLGVGNSTVTMWIRGERVPNPESCRKVAEVFYLPLDDVLTIAGHRPRDLDVDPDAPAEQIAAMARRVAWTEERYELVREMLTAMLERDRKQREKEG